jgi:hypothetical protein
MPVRRTARPAFDTRSKDLLGTLQLGKDSPDTDALRRS